MKRNDNQETISISEETIAKINQLEPDVLLLHGIIRLVPGKTDEYICPICGNGGSGNHDATGIKPKIYSSHVGWKCHRCGEKFDNLAIFAAHFGLSDKTDFVTLCQKICDTISLPCARNFAEITPQKKSDVNPAELNFINQDLAISTDALEAFLDAHSGAWRGLPFDTLDRFGCRYIDAWTPPKSRANQTYSTPTPRIIIPACYDGLHSNYLARLTVPAQKFEKIHAGKKTLFNVDALNSEEPVFAVEGYVDALSLEFVGFRAVATGGADTFNLLVDAVKPLKKKPDVIILFDPDDTGRKTAPKLKSALADVGCRAVIKFLSADVSKTDANSILQEQGADYLMNEIFAIEQEAIKDFETKPESTKSEPPKSESESAETLPDAVKCFSDEPEIKKPALMTLTNAQKEFLYSGDLSDLDAARRIEFIFGDEIRYLQDTNCWLILDKNNQGGGVWRNRGEREAAIEHYALELADALIKNACQPSQARFGKHFKKQNNRSNAIKTMKGLGKLIIHPEYLNRHKHLINVLNGVVDLQAGKLLPLNPNYLIMNQAGAAYIPDADTSFVEKFLADILPNEETRRAVLRYLGYCLTGMKNYHISEFWRGSGANGKSTLIDIVQKTFGSYAKKLPANGLLENRRPVDGNSATPAIAQLDGDVRLAIIDELPRNSRIDASLFKTLTGDETVYSRALYCNPRTIELRAKFIINGNHLPSFDTDDDGMLRRINNIPFTQKFRGNRADSQLAQKLSTPENLSAFLKLLVDEAKLFYRDGLLESDEMKEAKEEYIAENDFVSTFLVENCVTGQGGEITRKALEEKITAAYPRECARLKKKELLDQIISRLEPHGVIYKQKHHSNIFVNIRWADSDD